MESLQLSYNEHMTNLRTISLAGKDGLNEFWCEGGHFFER